MIPAEAVEAAYVSTAFIGKCEAHGERSPYGLPIDDAEAWVLAHNAQSHGTAK